MMDCVTYMKLSNSPVGASMKLKSMAWTRADGDEPKIKMSPRSYMAVSKKRLREIDDIYSSSPIALEEL